jgi:putative solute:sodium symporter small subunit
MWKIYQRECWVSLIAFVIVTFLTHIFPVYFLFPQIVEFTIFGFPAHYLMTMVVGWLVLIPAYWYYIKISEQIDQEIEQYEAQDDASRTASFPAGTEAAGGRR